MINIFWMGFLGCVSVNVFRGRKEIFPCPVKIWKILLTGVRGRMRGHKKSAATCSVKPNGRSTRHLSCPVWFSLTGEPVLNTSPIATSPVDTTCSVLREHFVSRLTVRPTEWSDNKVIAVSDRIPGAILDTAEFWFRWANLSGSLRSALRLIYRDTDLMT